MYLALMLQTTITEFICNTDCWVSTSQGVWFWWQGTTSMFPFLPLNVMTKANEGCFLNTFTYVHSYKHSLW